MKRLLLSVLVAVAAISASAQFKGSVDIKPIQNAKPRQISFNFAAVCKQLEVDRKEFATILQRGWYRQDSQFKLYLITDKESKSNDVSTMLTADGLRAEWDNRMWQCEIYADNVSMNRLYFNVALCLSERGDRPFAKVGDVCHATYALEYQGKTATFDITVNVTEQDGPLIPLSSLEKVGSEVLTGTYEYLDGLTLQIDVDKVAALFGGEVEGTNLQFYAMEDAEKELIIDGGIGSSATLNMDGTLNQEESPKEWVSMSYAFGNGSLSMGYGTSADIKQTDAFPTGQKTSGSVFLVADGKYYELILDIQIGAPKKDCESLDIVKTEQQEVQLMATQSSFTYYDKETNRFGLVSTEIDVNGAKALLGTETPVLYAEKKNENGDVVYSCRYTVAPGQGFWFTEEGYYSSYDNETPLGAYLTDGSLKWYAGPYSQILNAGNTYQLNLYLANPETGKAVKYEINVEIVEELQTESVAYVRSLPVGLTGSPNGIEKVQEVQGLKGSKFKVQGLFDLQGRRLMKAPEKGLYIQDGKVVIK